MVAIASMVGFCHQGRFPGTARKGEREDPRVSSARVAANRPRRTSPHRAVPGTAPANCPASSSGSRPPGGRRRTRRRRGSAARPATRPRCVRRTGRRSPGRKGAVVHPDAGPVEWLGSTTVATTPAPGRMSITVLVIPPAHTSSLEYMTAPSCGRTRRAWAAGNGARGRGFSRGSRLPPGLLATREWCRGCWSVKVSDRSPDYDHRRAVREPTGARHPRRGPGGPPELRKSARRRCRTGRDSRADGGLGPRRCTRATGEPGRPLRASRGAGPAGRDPRGWFRPPVRPRSRTGGRSAVRRGG